MKCFHCKKEHKEGIWYKEMFFCGKKCLDLTEKIMIKNTREWIRKFRRSYRRLKRNKKVDPLVKKYCLVSTRSIIKDLQSQLKEYTIYNNN